MGQKLTPLVLVGDALDCLRDERIATGSVQCVVTSPPYYNLRDYGVVGQMGRERTVRQYIEGLANLLPRLARVLRDDGTVWFNIGDTYDEHGLLLIPARFALVARDEQWCVRSDVVWRKTRYMPNGGKTRPVMIHEYVFMLTKVASGYYYNPDALREPHSPVSLKRWQSGVAGLGGPKSMGRKQADGTNQRKHIIVPNPLGKLGSSVWDICPSGYKGAHFAVMPEALAERCVLASSRKGDLVLDPFMGSGTTGVVALKHGRRFTGIELSRESAQLARERMRL